MKKVWFFFLAFLAALLSLPFAVQIHGDALIHYVFAENITRGYFFYFNPGEPSSGSTAPLWSLILGGLYALLGHGFLDLGAKAMGIALFALSVFLVRLLAMDLGGNERDAITASLIWAVHPYAGFWAASGMETSLAVVLFISGFILFSRSRYVPAGLVLGVAYLVRPESALLALILSAARPRKAHLLLLPTVLAALIWHGFLYFHTGNPVPASWLSRRFHALVYSIGPMSLLAGLHLFGFHFPLIVGLFRRRRVLPMVVIGAYFLAFTFIMPDTMGMRYLLPVAPLVVVLGVIGWWKRKWLLVLIMFPLVAGGYWLRHERALKNRDDNLRLKKAGDWIMARDPDALIAAQEVQVRWLSGCRVLSIDGVVDQTVIPYLQKKYGLADLLLERRPKYLVGPFAHVGKQMGEIEGKGFALVYLEDWVWGLSYPDSTQ
ncbi:MAG: hypothetical protein ACP5QG_00805 [candidate division WOR-3 bacterium]